MDEEEHGGLRALTEVLLGYGERHFEGPKDGKRGVWAGVLLMCGQFERVSDNISFLLGSQSYQAEIGRRLTLGTPRNRSRGRPSRNRSRLPRVA